MCKTYRVWQKCSKMHAFRLMPDNADAVYVISMGLVSNDVVMCELLNTTL